MSPPVVARRELRKAQRRAALIEVAQQLITERRSDASIRDITGMAEMGFGTFFNYFESKEELFEAAFASSLDLYGGLLDHLVSPIEDPAEAVSAGLRLTGRLQRRTPTTIKVLLSRGTLLMVDGEGLDERFRRRLRAGAAAGQFEVPDMDRSVMAVAGATMGLLQLLDLRPDLDAAVESDRFTVRTLVTIGVPAREAARIVALPLPELPGPRSPLWVGHAATTYAGPLGHKPSATAHQQA